MSLQVTTKNKGLSPVLSERHVRTAAKGLLLGALGLANFANLGVAQLNCFKLCGCQSITGTTQRPCTNGHDDVCYVTSCSGYRTTGSPGCSFANAYNDSCGNSQYYCCTCDNHCYAP